MPGKLDMLNAILQRLSAVPGVSGAVVASRGGLVIASKVAAGAHEETFAAMCATIAGAAAAAASEFRKPEPRSVMVDLGPAGAIVVAGAGPKAIIVAQVDDPAQAERTQTTLLELRDEVKEIVR